MVEQLKVVVVGHVDHGKSTLIGRLLYDTGSIPEEAIEEIIFVSRSLGREPEFAFIMDQLKEERDEGISIDTTQTFFRTGRREYVIIDSPGHKEFIKNMITGSSQAEASILVVDAQEGVRDETRRHAYILALLGLKQVIIAMNKMDLAEYDENIFRRVSKDVTSFLDQLKITPTHVIPISAGRGDNIANRSLEMDWYCGPTIVEALDSFKGVDTRKDRPLRFPVQDVYNISGKKIIVGRIEAGTIRVDQEIYILPHCKTSRVSSIEVFPRSGKLRSVTGESIGMIIEDELLVDRGDVICTKEGRPTMTKEIMGNLFWFENIPLKKGERLLFKCSTQDASCIVKAILKRMDSSTLGVIEENGDLLEEREVGEVILSFDQPIIVDDFNETPELGRFVIERGYNIVGGGIITHQGGLL